MTSLRLRRVSHTAETSSNDFLPMNVPGTDARFQGSLSTSTSPVKHIEQQTSVETFYRRIPDIHVGRAQCISRPQLQQQQVHDLAAAGSPT